MRGSTDNPSVRSLRKYMIPKSRFVMVLILKNLFDDTNQSKKMIHWKIKANLAF
jgi:hypothetical protein